MKLAGINQNCAFKSLIIHPYKMNYTQRFLTPYKDIIAKVSREKDLYIAAEDKVVEEGPDYSITVPVISVAIHPLEINDKKGMRLDKNYNKVINTAFTYVPSTQNEKDGKFAEVLQESLSLIG